VAEIAQAVFRGRLSADSLFFFLISARLDGRFLD